MCLEDRFLFALYNQPGFVSVKLLADDISITENALLSIINRINTGFPDYLLLQESLEGGAQVSPNAEFQQEVRLFLADGGFSAINEQELRDYYKMEMNRLQKIKNALQEYRWIKWASGTLLTIGGGFGIFIFIKSLKK